MTFTIGIDDAGRGPLIGPMFLSAVLLSEEQSKFLKKLDIKDSKQVIQETRVKLAKTIQDLSQNYKTLSVSPEEIDKAVNSHINLNTLEAIKSAELINALNTKKDKISVIVDCPSTNTSAWKNTLLEYVEHPENLQIKCEHKADENHIEAAAASILAKVARESAVEKIKKEFGNTGSGYPSDPRTQEFLKSKGEKLRNSGIFRKSWSTWTKIFPEDKVDIKALRKAHNLQDLKQKSLGDF